MTRVPSDPRIRALDTAWWGTDLGRHRTCSGTYERYAASRLPPVDDGVLPGFAFLLHHNVDGHAVDAVDAAQTPPLPALSSALQAQGLALPAPFVALMGNQRLLDQIPSVTACEWDLSMSPRKSRHPSARFTVRFLRDQQDCLFWYLLVGGDDDGKVLCSPIMLDDRHLDGVDADVVAEHSVIVAPTFPAFIWRFWMENVLWDLVQCDGPYTPAQQRYLDQLASR